MRNVNLQRIEKDKSEKLPTYTAMKAAILRMTRRK